MGSSALCCPACSESCADSIVIHEGEVDGVPGYLGLDRLVGVVHQETGCGCAPSFEALDADSAVVGYFEGPSCFGGVCDFFRGPPRFTFSRDRGGAGDKGEVFHRKSCAKDRMDIFLPMMPGADKLKMLAGAILLDYAFFARDHGLCRWRSSSHGVSATLGLCYGCGCFCPLALTCEIWPCGAVADDEKGPERLEKVDKGAQKAHHVKSPKSRHMDR